MYAWQVCVSDDWGGQLWAQLAQSIVKDVGFEHLVNAFKGDGAPDPYNGNKGDAKTILVMAKKVRLNAYGYPQVQGAG